MIIQLFRTILDFVYIEQVKGILLAMHTCCGES